MTAEVRWLGEPDPVVFDYAQCTRGTADRGVVLASVLPCQLGCFSDLRIREAFVTIHIGGGQYLQYLGFGRLLHPLLLDPTLNDSESLGVNLPLLDQLVSGHHACHQGRFNSNLLAHRRLCKLQRGSTCGRYPRIVFSVGIRIPTELGQFSLNLSEALNLLLTGAQLSGGTLGRGFLWGRRAFEDGRTPIQTTEVLRYIFGSIYGGCAIGGDLLTGLTVTSDLLTSEDGLQSSRGGFRPAFSIGIRPLRPSG